MAGSKKMSREKRFQKAKMSKKNRTHIEKKDSRK